MEKHIKVPMTREEAKQLKAGDYVYLTGTIYTARDAAHKRMQETLTAGKRAADFNRRNNYLLHGIVPGAGRKTDRFCRTDNCEPNG